MFNAPTEYNYQALKFIMSATGTYDDIYLRPYVLSYDKYKENHLQEATRNGVDLSAATLSDVAPTILRPSTEAGSIAPVVNGFAEKRFRFMIEMTPSVGLVSSGVRHVLTGYTDELGVSTITGQPTINRNMRMFLNAAYVIRDEPSPYGTGIVSKVTESYQFLQNPAAATDMMQALGLYALRPEDMFVQMSTDKDSFSRQSGLISVNEQTCVNGRILRNSRNMASPASWLSKSLNAYKAALITDDSSDPTRVNIYDRARTESREAAVNRNQFMRILTTDYNITRDGSISFHELCCVIGGLEHVMEVNNPTGMNAAKLYQRGQYCGWHNSTNNTIAANMLIMQVPAILLPHAMGAYSFFATNKVANLNGTMSHNNMYGIHRIDPISLESFASGVDLSPQIPIVNHHIANSILSQLPENGSAPYEMTVDINMLGDAVVHVSIGDDIMTPYAAPVFCDAMYASVLTGNATHITNMTEGMQQMVDSVNRMVGDAQSVQAPIMTTAPSNFSW